MRVFTFEQPSKAGIRAGLLAFLGMMAAGCGKSNDELAISTNHLRAAFSGLPSRPQEAETVGPLLAQDEARRLVESCYALARLDPERHGRIWSANPAVAYARDLLRTGAEPSSPIDRHFRDFHGPQSGDHGAKGPDRSGPEPSTEKAHTPRPEAGPDAPPPPQVQTGQTTPPVAPNDPASAIELEIRDLSLRYAQNVAHKNIRSMLEVESTVKVLHRDLTHALGDQASALLPDDPLSLLGEPALKAARDGAVADQRRLEAIHAIFPSPDLKVSLNALGAYIADLDEAIRSDEPGKFHRARDALANALDNEKWAACRVDTEVRVAAENGRLRKMYRVSMPTEKWELWEPILPIPPPFDPYYPRSAGISKALGDYLISPHDGLRALARFEAEFHALKNLASEARARVGIAEKLSARVWMAENLADHHLGLNYAWFSNLLDAAEGHLEIKDPGWDLGADATIREYLRGWVKILSAEVDRRRSGGRSGDLAHPFASGTVEAMVAADYAGPPKDQKPSAAEKAAMVRLSIERYGREVAHMPTATRDLLRLYTTDSLKDAFSRTRSLSG